MTAVVEEKNILYDIVFYRRVVDFFMATSPDEALKKYHRFKNIFGPKFKEGLYGYPRTDVKHDGLTAVPSFAN